MQIIKFHPYIKNFVFLWIALFSIQSISFGYVNNLRHKPSKLDTLEKVSMMFMVEHGQLNSFDIKSHPAFKKYEEDFQFNSSTELPEGLQLSIDGILAWSPSTEQFNALKNHAFLIDFIAESTTTENVVVGQIRVIGQGELKVEEKTATIKENITPINSEKEDDKIVVPISIHLPTSDNWDEVNEGGSFSFQLEAAGGSGKYKFELIEPSELMANLDQYGNFNWIPDYDFTSIQEKTKTIFLNIKAFDDAGNNGFATIPLYIHHVNRPPVVHELPTFYVQFNNKNKYQLNKKGLIYDPDGDSIIFKPVLKELPQGGKLSEKGEITWEPSKKQFNFLSKNPMYLSFIVEDLPEGAKTMGQIFIEVSQADLPPLIAIIPNKETFEIKENEELHLNFFITDPNGEDDLNSFGFVSENSAIEDNALVEKSNWQYEFSWTPGFDFIKEKDKKEEFTISFFVVDKESNRTEKSVSVIVQDTENLLEKDRILYDQYRTVLERAWDMIIQLNEKEKVFEKEYKKAKKGKKNRAIVTASLGGITGLSALIDGDGQKAVSAIGGTATATLGTLEASNVIGEPPAEVMQKLTYVSQKRNDLLVYGNVFASKYALPLSRRGGSFQNDLSNLSIHLNLKDVAKLELDSSWENSKKPTDRNIKKVYKDFNSDTRFEDDYKY